MRLSTKLHLLLLLPFFITTNCMQQEFYTINGYNNLSKSKRKELYCEADKKLRSCISEHAVLDPMRSANLISLAQDISKMYPNDTICGLGQSPAYMIETMQRLAQLQDNPVDRFKKIPFSSKWYSYVEEKYQSHSYSWFFRSVPNDQDKASYKKQLTSILGQPAELIQQYEQDQKKIVILEYVETGESLISFVSILKEWLYDAEMKGNQITNVVKFELFKRMLGYDCRAACAPFDCGVTSLLADEYLCDVVGTLANSDFYKDRLVPYYPFKKWQTQNPNDFILSRNAKLCLFMLTDRIVKKSKKNN